MPLRIMVWNIQNFGRATIKNNMSFGYIVDSIKEVNPAILVVIEGKSGNEPAGLPGLIVRRDSAVAVATIALLEALRKFSSNWYVVPPRTHGSSGMREGITVFFKSDLVHFCGPHRVDTIPGNNGQRSQSSAEFDPYAPAPHTDLYDPPWHDALPATPPRCPVGGLNQNQLAGKTNFNPQGGGFADILYFPYPQYRPPLLTSFCELALGRTIKVFALHLPPQNPEAELAVQNVMMINEVIEPLSANEVRVILGDFNINLWDGQQAPNPQPQPSRMYLEERNIPQTGGAGTTFAMCNIFDPTILKPTKHASPAGVPPYLDYIGLDQRCCPNALDYIFAAFGTTARHIPTNGYVVDRVVGTPMREQDKLIKPAFSMVLGGELPEEILLFRAPHNYGKVRDASDHMAVYADL
ncbi:MAG: endonuclease/exonuclease/phosphatase family protein [Pseudonocardiaceae bacterium]